MAMLKTKAVQIDTVQLVKEMQELAASARKKTSDLAVESLQAIVDAIQEADTRRLSQLNGKTVSSGTKDAPLAGAKAVTSLRRASFPETRNKRLIVYVKHEDPDTGANIFNILDAGTKARTLEEYVTFPRYTGSTTPPFTSDKLGNPKLVRSVIRASIQLERGPNGAIRMVTLKPGQVIQGFDGRLFYESSAKWVISQLVDQGIANESRRSTMKLKKSDIIVSVPDRPRFNV